MAYKRTGRPPGRPKTKEYVTLMARVPQDVADQAKRYAGLHRQTMSVVLRDGLLMLLQEQDPYRPYMSDMNTAQEIMSDTNIREEIMSDVNSLHDMEARGIVSDMKDVAEPQPRQPDQTPQEDILAWGRDQLQRQRAVADETLGETTEDQRPLNVAPAFDASKYMLGKLCPRAHDYHGTGKSLLRASNRHCLACDREKFHERKQAKRQTRPA